MKTTKDLPTPRLQLRWEKLKKLFDGGTWLCHYELVMMLRPYDIRHKKCDELSGRSAERSIKMPGGTRVRYSVLDTPVSLAGSQQSRIDIPFRDGVHILWDSVQLKLPAFVVCGEQAEEIKSGGK